MPAQAAVTSFELMGVITIYEPAYPAQLRNDYRVKIFGSGGTYEPVGYADESGFSINLFGMPALYTHFRFLEAPLSDPFDGQFHEGVGGGSVTSCFSRYCIPISYPLILDHARLWQTEEPEYDSFGWALGPEVPEPATWAMMISGFALAGMAMRRKSSTIAFG